MFDTAFHATIPDEAATYAIPQRWRDWGVRRYGFHGLSVQWSAERVQVPRLVVCHLGGGSSVTPASVTSGVPIAPNATGAVLATRQIAAA